jgi:hypothetical protein
MAAIRFDLVLRRTLLNAISVRLVVVVLEALPQLVAGF